MSINRITLIGFLGKDAEERVFPSGDPVLNFSMATTDSWFDKKTEERKERTEWHRVVVTGKNVEYLRKLLVKGAKVMVEGSVRNRKWTDSVSGLEKQITEVRAEVCEVMTKGVSAIMANPIKMPVAEMPDDLPF